MNYHIPYSTSLTVPLEGRRQKSQEHQKSEDELEEKGEEWGKYIFSVVVFFWPSSYIFN